MARRDWYYINIKQDMAVCLDYIIKKDGDKYGFDDRVQLIRWIIGEFIGNWERDHNAIIAKDGLRLYEKDRKKKHGNPIPTIMDADD